MFLTMIRYFSLQANSVSSTFWKQSGFASFGISTPSNSHSLLNGWALGKIRFMSIQSLAVQSTLYSNKQLTWQSFYQLSMTSAACWALGSKTCLGFSENIQARSSKLHSFIDRSLHLIVNDHFAHHILVFDFDYLLLGSIDSQHTERDDQQQKLHFSEWFCSEVEKKVLIVEA